MLIDLHNHTPLCKHAKGNPDEYIKKAIKIFFIDEMRYGLISNYRRSWSKVGERTIIDNQQEYSNRYLYSAIDPINGDNFHMYSISDVNTLATKTFLDKLKEFYK